MARKEGQYALTHKHRGLETQCALLRQSMLSWRLWCAQERQCAEDKACWCAWPCAAGIKLACARHVAVLLSNPMTLCWSSSLALLYPQVSCVRPRAAACGAAASVCFFPMFHMRV